MPVVWVFPMSPGHSENNSKFCCHQNNINHLTILPYLKKKKWVGVQLFLEDHIYKEYDLQPLYMVLQVKMYKAIQSGTSTCNCLNGYRNTPTLRLYAYTMAVLHLKTVAIRLWQHCRVFPSIV